MAKINTVTPAFSSAAVLAAAMALAAQAQAQEAGSAAAITACARTAELSIPNTSLDTEFVTAGAFTAPGPAGPFAADYSQLPAFCRVTGSIHPTAESDIRFELWLPADDWNGRFMQTGNGGAAGSIVLGSLVDPLSRGYAVANTDTGHQGGGGDFSWAVGQPEKLIDFQYRAVHELTVVGKAITAAHYAQAPEKSYWLGCSTGGRQGLLEAQRYPEDYDAMIAGAPASNWIPLMSLSVEIQRNLGPDGLGLDKLPLLKEASIAACDADDGVVDRVISAPAQCGFDPAQLQCSSATGAQCLTATEVAAARRIYAGVVDANGNVIMPGTGFGSEPPWGAYASAQFSIGTNYFRQVVTGDADWDPTTFDVEADVAAALRVDNGASSAMNPDLSAFIERGGKLITFHGTTDGLIPHGNSVNYHHSVVELLGEETVEDSVRFYLMPGVDHCSGGEGAFDVDMLSALEAWVEDGVAPQSLIAAHPPIPTGPPGSPPSEAFTRPLCPYPAMARYSGQGDARDAANFECVSP